MEPSLFGLGKAPSAAYSATALSGRNGAQSVWTGKGLYGGKAYLVRAGVAMEPSLFGLGKAVGSLHRRVAEEAVAMEPSLFGLGKELAV